MEEIKYTSLKLSKLLSEAGCELESKVWWYHFKSYATEDGYKPKWAIRKGYESEGAYSEKIPAYDILNDICVKYAKEFWKEEDVGHTSSVLCMLRVGRSKEYVEGYIWEHCLFNDKN